MLELRKRAAGIAEEFVNVMKGCENDEAEDHKVEEQQPY